MFYLLLSSLILSSVSWDCPPPSIDQNDEKVHYFSSLDFPTTLRGSRTNFTCSFSNTTHVNHIVFTNANLCNVSVICDGKTENISKLNTSENFYHFSGHNVSFSWIPQNDSEVDCLWQAFQAVHYSGSTSSNFYADSLSSDLFLMINEHGSVTNDFHDLFILKSVLIYNLTDVNDNVSLSGVNFTYNGKGFGRQYFKQYFGRQDVDEDIVLSLNTNSNFNNKSQATLFVTGAKQGSTFVENCTNKHEKENLWIFSTSNDHYPNNAHCLTQFSSVSNKQCMLWFDRYDLEPFFDNITIKTSLEYGAIRLNNSRYIVPDSDFLIEFYSDETIVRGGFALNIEHFDCDCGTAPLNVSCDGLPKKRYFLSGNDPKYLCSMQCSLQIIVDDACENDTVTVMIQIDLDLPQFVTFEWDLLILNRNNQRHWNRGLTQSMLFNYNRSNIYFLYYLFDQNYQVMEISDVPFVLKYQRYNSTNDIQIKMDANNSAYYLNVVEHQKTRFNVEFDDSLNNYTFELFFATSDVISLSHLSIYDKSTNFLFGFDESNHPSIVYMPYVYSSTTSDFSFFYGFTSKSSRALVFLQIKEVTSKNCLFQQNVVDTKKLVASNSIITMVANGTKSCPITLLNTEIDKTYFLTNFWTTSVNEVKIYQNYTLLSSFNKTTASKFANVNLIDAMYQIFLPFGSITMKIRN